MDTADYFKKASSLEAIPYFRKAPFKKTEIRNINRFQNLGIVHPLTCKNDHRKDRVLVPEELGLVCPTCGYVQTWAPVCATNTQLVDSLEELLKEYKASCQNQNDSDKKSKDSKENCTTPKAT